MHELSLCRALIREAERYARDHPGQGIRRITLRLGPLSGAEAVLLQHAFPLAARGSLAEGAALVIEPVALRVACLECGAESEATPSRLRCSACNSHRTRLLSGDELLLASLEFTAPDN